MRVVIASPIVEQEFRQRLQTIPGIEQDWAANDDEMQRKAKGADIIVMSGLAYSAGLANALRDAPGKLKFLQLLTAGYEALEMHGVPAAVRVANAGAVWSPVVADHAMALILGLARRMPDIIASQGRRQWDYSGIAPRVWSLQGSRMTIVGFGSIGQELAQRARGFGIRVTGVTRSGQPHPLADRILPAGALTTALADADIVVLAVPLSAATRHLIGAAELAACKPGAVLVNMARGSVLDSQALRNALAEGRIAGAALDVADPEPLPSDDPLWTTPKLIISPHVGGAAGPLYYHRLVDFVSENIQRFLRGEAPASDITSRLS